MLKESLIPADTSPLKNRLCPIVYNPPTKSVMKSLIRPIALFFAFISGFLFPQGAIFTPWIARFIQVMLFIIFLKFDFGKVRLRKSHFRILGLNLLFAVGSCELFRFLGNEVLAQNAFFIGIAPTGTATAAVTGFLGGDVNFVVTSFMLNTLGVAFSIPFLLPWSLRDVTPGVFWLVAGNVAWLILVPMLAGQLVRYLWPSSRRWPDHLQNFMFALWVLMVAIICSNAATFLQKSNELFSIVFNIAVLTATMCFFHFFCGYCLGDPQYRHESSQSLGQKNVGIIITLALMYADPLAALGPTLYVFAHNTWNAIQLGMIRPGKQNLSADPTPPKNTAIRQQTGNRYGVVSSRVDQRAGSSSTGNAGECCKSNDPNSESRTEK